MTTEERYQRIEFKANAQEYFAIWISNLALSILTLGIYSAWAKVRRMRYMLGNTRILGAVLQYHATGKQIFIGRIISVVIILIYSGIPAQSFNMLGFFYLVMIFVLPYLLYKGLAFRFRMVSWNNIHFRWNGDYTLAFRALIPLYIAFAPLLLAPFFIDTRFLQTGEIPTDPVFKQFMILSYAAFGFTLVLYPWGMWHLAKETLNQVSWGGIRLYAHWSLKAYYLSTAFFLYLPLLIVAIAIPAPIAYFFSSTNGVIIAVMLVLACWFIFYLVYRQMIRGFLINYLEGKDADISAITFATRYRWLRLIWINISNLIAVIVSIGFLIPWATIRLERYLLEQSAVHVRIDLEQMLDQQQEALSATAAEYSEMEGFDFDPW